MQAIAPVIRDYFNERTRDLHSSVARLEAEVQQLQQGASPGRDGLPGAPGTPGRDGRDGLGFDDQMIIYDGERIGDLGSLVTRLEFEIKRLREEARPGRDGLPGAPGTPGRDGRDGVPGNDGKDGLGFDDLTVNYDGDRTLTLAFVQADHTRSFPVALPIVLDRGVWRDGQYVQGDAVTYAGALWIAQRQTAARPGEGPEGGWRLAVKAPRHGKSAFDLARSNGFSGTDRQWLASLKGERGPEGRPGRDGRNW
jgi:hypothetical protein